MPAKSTFSDKHVKVLHEVIADSTDPNEIVRATALLMLAKGILSSQVAGALRCSAAYLRRVKAEFLKQRPDDAVAQVRSCGRPTHFSYEQEAAILDGLMATAKPKGVAFGDIYRAFADALRKLSKESKPLSRSTAYDILRRHDWRKTKRHGFYKKPSRNLS